MERAKIIHLLGRAIDIIVIAGGSFLALLMFYNVLSRNLLNTDLAWSMQLSKLLLLWLSFLGAAIATNRRSHLQVTEVIRLFKPRTRLWIEVYIQIVVACFLGLMIYYGTILSQQMMNHTSMSLNIPIGLWYLSMPVGCGLMMIFVLDDLRILITKRQPLLDYATQINETIERNQESGIKPEESANAKERSHDV